MGNGVSTEEIAARVRSIGEGAYETYARAIEVNGVDGATIKAYEKVEELLDDLEVRSRLHRRRLAAEVEKKAPGGQTDYAVSIVVEREVEGFLASKMGEIGAVIGTSQAALMLESKKALTWAERGWRSGEEFERELCASLLSAQRGVVAKNQSRRDAELLAHALELRGFKTETRGDVRESSWSVVVPVAGEFEAWVTQNLRPIARLLDLESPGAWTRLGFEDDADFASRFASSKGAAIVGTNLSRLCADLIASKLSEYDADVVPADHDEPIAAGAEAVALVRAALEEAPAEAESSSSSPQPQPQPQRSEEPAEQQVATGRDREMRESLEDVFDFGRLTRPPRPYLAGTSRASRQLARNQCLFAHTLPAVVLNFPKGQSKYWEIVRTKFLPSLTKSGWEIGPAIEKMRTERLFDDVDALVADFPDMDSDDIALVEHVASTVRELLAAGLHFNVRQSVRHFLVARKRLFSNFADAIVEGCRWTEIEAQVLPAQESAGWELTEPARMMRDGERDLATLTDNVDPSTGAVVEALLKLVLAKDGDSGGTPGDDWIPSSPGGDATESAHLLRLADATVDESDIDSEDENYYEYGRLAANDRTLAVPDTARAQIHHQAKIFFGDLPALVRSPEHLPRFWTKFENDVLPRLEAAGWVIGDAVRAMRDGNCRDLDYLVAFMDDNEAAVTEHVLVALEDLRAHDLQFNINKRVRRFVTNADRFLRRLARAVEAREDTAHLQPQLDRMEQGGWHLAHALDLLKLGETDIIKLTAQCDPNSAVVVNAVLNLVRGKPPLPEAPAPGSRHRLGGPRAAAVSSNSSSSLAAILQ